MNLLIGADPEFFLKDRETGKFVSAYGMIEGTKKNPLKVDGGAVQVDGMALEFNINPASSFAEFDENITKVLHQLRQMIDDKYEFVFKSVAHFDEEYIRNQPMEARQLGCEPDFEAYTGKPNPTPDANKNFRTASGHLHFGWTENEDVNNPEHIEACQMLVKQLDTHVGLADVILDPYSIRRQLYGKAGAYRVKPYGVEYRTPGNVWVKDREARKIMFDYGMWCFDQLIEGNQWKHTNIKETINSNSVPKAFYSIGYTRNVPRYVRDKYTEWSMQELTKKVIVVENNKNTTLSELAFQNVGWDIFDEMKIRPAGRRIVRDELGRFARG